MIYMNFELMENYKKFVNVKIKVAIYQLYLYIVLVNFLK